MTALVLVSRLPFKNHFRQIHNFWCDRMRPRVAEAESGSSFLGSNFRWGFDGGAERITKRVGIFSVRVIDTPQFVFGVRC